MIKAVLFDFDETLQDRTQAFEGYMDTFFAEFFPELSSDEIEKRKEEMRITGNGGYVMANGYKNRDEWFEDLARRWGWENAPSGAELTNHYDTTFGDHNVIFPNAPVLLKALKEKGYTVGLITNGPSYLQHHKLEVSGLAEYFDIVVVSGDVGIHKPDPALFTYTAEKYNLNPAECVYVGDHPINDIEGATKAGMKAIRVNGGWFKDKDLRDDVPTVNDIIEVYDLIEENNAQAFEGSEALEQDNMEYNYNENNTEPKKEKINIGLAILSVIFFPAGLIIFISKRKNNPKTAKVCVVCAIISLIVSVGVALLGFDGNDAPENIENIKNTITSNIEKPSVTNDSGEGTSTSAPDKTTDKSTSAVQSTSANKVDTTGKENSTTKEKTTAADEPQVYTNDYMKIKFTMPDKNWSVSSYKDLVDSINGAKYDEKTDSVILDAVVEKSYFYALASNTVTSTNIQFMAIEARTSLTSKMDADEYLQTTVEAIVGENALVSEPKDVQIGSDTYSRINAKYKSQGTTINQAYLCKKDGKLYPMVIITCVSQDSSAAIEECISNLSSID